MHLTPPKTPAKTASDDDCGGMPKLTKTQALVLAAAARWPLNYTVWADGFAQAHLELPNGLQAVKSPTTKNLLERGLLAQTHDGDLLEVTAAGHEALTSSPTAAKEVSTPGWRLTSTQEHRAGFTVGGTRFTATTSGWPTSTSADLMTQHAARSIAALHDRAPEKFEVELARFNAGVPSAFAAIAEEALTVVHLLHPEIDGYANNFTLRISPPR